MRSVTQAILWEFWRCGRTLFLATTLVVVAFAAFPLLWEGIRGGFDETGALHVDQEYLRTLFFCSVALHLLAFPGVVLVAQGQPSRHYARPLSTTHIVTCHLLTGALISATLSLVVICALNYAFGIQWPILGPTLLVAATTIGIQGMVWLGRGNQTIESLGGMLAFATPILWFKSRMGALSSSPEHYWANPTHADFWTIAAFAGIGSVLALAAIARDRRGDGPKWLRLREFLDRLSVPFLSPEAPFRSPAQAQFWFEWRQKGWWLPLTMICGLIVVISVSIATGRLDRLQGGLSIVAGTLVLVGVAAGVNLGRFHPKAGRYELGSFLATRPISDAGITGATLGTGVTSLIVACVLWIGAWTLSSISDVTTEHSLLSAAASALPPAFAIFCFGWLLLSIVSCVMMTGRPKPFVIALNVVILLILITASLGLQIRFDAWDHRLSLILCFTLAAGMLLVTTAMFFLAYRRKLIGWKTAVLGLAPPAIGTLAEISMVINHANGNRVVEAIWLIIVALLLAPVAAGPLAVAWNRHR